jgi:hypothetical protein
MRKIALLFVGLVAFNCNQAPNKEMASADFAAKSYSVEASLGEADGRQQGTTTEVTRERMLIKTGNLSMQVNDVKEARKKIGEITKSMNAYLSEEELNDYGERLNISIIIRVPSSKYDTLVESIERVGEKTDSKSVNVQDVTEEYIDVEARLKTKKELEARYREILKQANTVTDILSVESNLNNVRAEIESREGRLKYLMSQVSFSTLNLNFYQKISTDYGFGGKFADGLGNGWTNFLTFFIGLANIWPFLILIGGVVWFFIRWRKKRKATAAQ